jgi:hypothetical protein
MTVGAENGRGPLWVQTSLIVAMGRHPKPFT